MEDEAIIRLYHMRSENAIRETEKKYGRLCRSIAEGILNDKRDSEEALEDAWMTLWQTIPPKEPNPFKAYVCRVIKNLSLKKLEYNQAKKRRSEYDVALEELAECVDSRESVEDEVLKKELIGALNQFLESLPEEKQNLFMRRYWFLEPVKDIARGQHIAEKTASRRLAKLREQLREYLIEEGYIL